jgi:hypothetical protein
VQSTKFDLVANMTTAKALGMKIPEAFLLRADEVIEWRGAISSRCSACDRVAQGNSCAGPCGHGHAGQRIEP